MADTLNINCPPGRLISGSLTVKNTTDHENRPLPPEKHNFYIGVAVRKDQPGINEFIGAAYQHAVAGYARNPLVSQEIAKGFAGRFAWKISDGDQPNREGKKQAHAEGCWIIRMSTTFPIKACSNQNVEIDPKLIVRGYYVDVNIGMAINEATGDQAGLYMNPNIVRLLGYGEIIHSGITAEQAFGGTPAPALPVGASAVPIAGAGAGAPGGMPAGMPGAAAPGLPATPAAPPAGMPGAAAPVAPVTPPAGMPGAAPYPQFLQPGAPATPPAGGMPGVGN